MPSSAKPAGSIRVYRGVVVLPTYAVSHALDGVLSLVISVSLPPCSGQGFLDACLRLLKSLSLSSVSSFKMLLWLGAKLKGSAYWITFIGLIKSSILYRENNNCHRGLVLSGVYVGSKVAQFSSN
ncbi:hypothetical protein Nepgr_011021 [Nepenthes gracilis]|uniref:Uncharacterized protein n=1 Tax=Nepenthes gracilis TaxID=150966 RepID=A0AAD3XLZ6_NEPGR|nr:hypothetical protein Nepgr_011021 [Nepenthes gracilis]